MRNALLLSLVLVGSAFLLPSATASPPCMPEDTSCPQPPPTVNLDCRKVPDRQPLLEVTDDCRFIVTLDLFSCPFGEAEVSQTVGPVVVRYDTCQPCYYNPCPPPVEEQGESMADPFPTCIRECSPLPMEACELRDATPAPLQTALWGYDCTLDVETACLGGASSSTERRVGFVNVSIAHCDTPDWS